MSFARALPTIVVLAGCGGNVGSPLPGPKVNWIAHDPALHRLFPGDDGNGSERFAGCIWASPLAVDSQGERSVLVASADGTIAAIAPRTGATSWKVKLDAPAGQEPFLLSTPVVVDGNLVVAYQLRDAAGKTRLSHRVAVIDLEARALHPAFPTVELTASIPAADGNGPVVFHPSTQTSRAALKHGRVAGHTLGYVYVSFGNIQDIQPWHGWVFELDLDAWLARRPAVSGTLVTTAESDCSAPGSSGARERVCGGGVWGPAGPTLVPTGETFELFVPSGNGQLDLGRADYANAMLRVGPGLAAHPGCDASACAGPDPANPSPACLASCKDSFVPRLLPGNPPLAPESGACDGKSFFECYAALDYDLGANSAVRVDRFDALVLPGKDGAVYLVDGTHLGTLHDRQKVVDVCGTRSDPCGADWAGMIVTRPVIADVDGATLAVIPTFEFDTTHPAGLVALEIAPTDLGPRFAPRWEAPAFASDEARAQFRRHTGRAVVAPWGGEPFVWVVDVRGRGGRGLFYGVRLRDGEVVERAPLAGAGQRYIEPLLLDGALYVTSCASDDGPGQLEGFELVSGRILF